MNIYIYIHIYIYIEREREWEKELLIKWGFKVECHCWVKARSPRRKVAWGFLLSISIESVWQPVCMEIKPMKLCPGTNMCPKPTDMSKGYSLHLLVLTQFSIWKMWETRRWFWTLRFFLFHGDTMSYWTHHRGPAWVHKCLLWEVSRIRMFLWTVFH